MTGFGATLIVVPCFIYLYGPVNAAVLASVLELPAVLYLLPTVVREADWRYIAPVGLASILTIPLGAWLLISVDPDNARLIIAIAVIGFALALATGWRYQGDAGVGLRAGVGAASGIMSGMASIGGPPVVMFLIASKTAAAGVRIGIMAYFTFTTLYRIPTYAILGIYTTSAVTLGASLIPAYLFGIWFGTKMFPHLSETWFLRIAIGLVLSMGLVALIH